MRWTHSAYFYLSVQPKHCDEHTVPVSICLCNPNIAMNTQCLYPSVCATQTLRWTHSVCFYLSVQLKHCDEHSACFCLCNPNTVMYTQYLFSSVCAAQTRNIFRVDKYLHSCNRFVTSKMKDILCDCKRNWKLSFGTSRIFRWRRTEGRTWRGW